MDRWTLLADEKEKELSKRENEIKQERAKVKSLTGQLMNELHVLCTSFISCPPVRDFTLALRVAKAQLKNERKNIRIQQSKSLH